MEYFQLRERPRLFIALCKLILQTFKSEIGSRLAKRTETNRDTLSTPCTYTDV